MSEQDLPGLIAEQRKLLIEETIIYDLLKKVRDEMHKLQIEQLQLDSMILSEDGNREMSASTSETLKTTMDMDSAETVNQEKLNLSVTGKLNEMFHGKFCVGDEDEDEDEEEDEDDEEETAVYKEEFILPI